MKLLQLRQRDGVTSVNIAEEILGLVPELIQVGSDGQATMRHDEPPEVPGVRWRRARRFVVILPFGTTCQVDSVLSADGMRPARTADDMAEFSLPPSATCHPTSC